MRKSIFEKIWKSYAQLMEEVREFNMRVFINKNWLHLFTLVALLGTGVGVGNLTYQYSVLSEEHQATVEEKNILSAGYTRTNITLKKTEKELAKYQTNLKITTAHLVQEKENVALKEREIGELNITVDTLEKLTTLDPELLQKYSKVFFLNENYEPPQVFPIPNLYKYYEERDVSVHAHVWPYLQGLLLASGRDGVVLYILSGYRSFEEQQTLKSNYTITYGAGTANQFSADQGYSEHQLGTTLDFITTGLGGRLDGFENTAAYTWMQEHAHKFGFTLSYPEKNGHYIFEPWHWRFVGIKLATDLHDQEKHFHDLSQRELDEYLLYIFD
ncbi:M15 family metallopeptidase [Patescibacteria group bacterium]